MGALLEDGRFPAAGRARRNSRFGNWISGTRNSGMGMHYDEKWEYVRQNPVRAGLVAESDDWPHRGEMHALRL